MLLNRDRPDPGGALLSALPTAGVEMQMSATQWKTRGFVLPYAPRNWPIAHVALCSVEPDAPEEPRAIDAGVQGDEHERFVAPANELTAPSHAS